MELSDRLLDPTTGHDFVDALVRDQWDRREHATFYLCIALRRLYRDNVHRASACSMFSDYVEQTFGIPGKLAWTFSQLGEHLERLPVTRAAMERGDVGYTKVREFATFVDQRSERAWVEFARNHSNRELERRVREHHAELTGKPYVPEAKVRSKLTPKGAQAVRAVQRKLTKDLDRPVKKEEMLELLSVRAVEVPVVGSAEDPAPKKPAGPYLAIHLCPSCTGTWVPTPGENLPVAIDEWVESFRAGAPVVNLMGHDLCECSGTKHRADLCPERRAPDGPAATSRCVPAEVRRQVEARDGFRCRVPGCTSCGALEISHLRPFRDGVPMDPRILAQHCAVHNRLIETGRLRVSGFAPYESYHLEDGTFLGVGYDPVVRGSVLPHVGQEGGAMEEGSGRATGT